jgi:hypothetical protein
MRCPYPYHFQTSETLRASAASVVNIFQALERFFPTIGTSVTYVLLLWLCGSTLHGGGFQGQSDEDQSGEFVQDGLRARRAGEPVSDSSGGDGKADHDQQADQQINRNIELICYKKFADELLLFELEDGFTRDVSIVGHFKTKNLEVTVRNENDFERAEYLIQQSYELS